MLLAYREFGAEGLPPLVILHGLLGSSRNWQAVARDLAVRHRVFALDLRNHGASPHDPRMDYEAMVGDVVAWLAARSLGPVALLGHSMGGKAAMLLACRHPERASSLVVVDIAPKDYLSRSHRAEFAAMQELRLEGLRSRAEAELRLEARVPDWAMRKFLVTNLETSETGEWSWMVNLPSLASALPALELNPLSPEDRYEGPCLFIAGGRSRYVEAGDLAAMERHFPRARLEVMPDAGHNPHLDDREGFVALLQEL
jgi:pimeloyl-ACP methyl ester carboxylesterase